MTPNTKHKRVLKLVLYENKLSYIRVIWVAVLVFVLPYPARHKLGVLGRQPLLERLVLERLHVRASGSYHHASNCERARKQHY